MNLSLALSLEEALEEDEDEFLEERELAELSPGGLLLGSLEADLLLGRVLGGEFLTGERLEVLDNNTNGGTSPLGRAEEPEGLLFKGVGLGGTSVILFGLIREMNPLEDTGVPGKRIGCGICLREPLVTGGAVGRGMFSTGTDRAGEGDGGTTLEELFRFRGG